MWGYLVTDMKYLQELNKSFLWYLEFYVSNCLDGGIQTLCVDNIYQIVIHHLSLAPHFYYMWRAVLG